MLVIAHRGSSGSAPENTMVAFRMAVEAGVDMIELDVRMTKDCELVVLHDRSLRRTTNGSGYIWDRMLAELRSLDAGSWYAPRFKGERILSLREVLDALPPAVGFNIEVKTDGDPRKRIPLEESCVLAVRGQKVERRVLISSFDHRFLQRLHKVDPALPTGALYLPVRDVGRKPSTIARNAGTSAFICSRSHLRKSFVKDSHQHDITIASYVVNTLRHLAKVRRFGVDAVITDFPEKIIRALRNG